MATFTTLQNDVYAFLGLDSTDSTNQTNVKRWINIAQQDICGRWPWNFLKSRETLTTVPDYKTGTVSVNSASTTVTGVGTTFTSTMAGGQYFIQFAGANDWYKITAFSSATSITIETGYAPSTNLSGGTYTIRKWYYSLSSSADRILDIQNRNTPLKMFETDARTLDSVSPNPQSTNSSYAFMGYGYDSSGNVQLSPYPFPADARLFEVRTLKVVSDLVNGTDTSIIPSKWHHILEWGACAIGCMWLRKVELAEMWNEEYEKKIKDMMMQAKVSEDDAPVLKSIDSVARSTFIQLPGNYPVVGAR